MNVPAPHNEKQRRTIAIFAIQFMRFQAYRTPFIPKLAPGGADM